LAKQKPERKRYLTDGLRKQNVATKSVTSTDGTLTAFLSHQSSIFFFLVFALPNYFSAL
jgi:hypothetical protein